MNVKQTVKTKGIPDDDVTTEPMIDEAKVRDYRARMINDLNLPALDAEHTEISDAWIGLNTRLGNIAKQIRQHQEAYDKAKADVVNGIDRDDLKGGTKDERKEEVEAIVNADDTVVTLRGMLTQAKEEKEDITTEMANCEKSLGKLSSALNWRGRMIGFYTSLGKIRDDTNPQPVYKAKGQADPATTAHVEGIGL